MQKRNFFLILLLSAFFSCAEKKLVNKIPADADAVLLVDFKKLALKSIDPEILFSPEILSVKDASTEVWKKSGLNFLSEAVLFSRTKTQTDRSWYFFFPLSDADDFREFCKRNGAEPDPENGNNWLIKNKVRILIQDDFAFGILPAENKSAKKYKEEANEILNLTEDGNLFSHQSAFQFIAKDEKPLRFWTNPESAFSGLDLFLPSEILKGQFYGSVDFKSGEMTMDARFLADDSLKRIAFLGAPIQQDILTNIANQSEQAGVFAISLSLEPIYQLLETLGYSSTGSIMAAQYGLHLEDLLKTLSGEFVFSALGAKENQQEFPPAVFRIGLKGPANEMLTGLSASGLIVPAGKDKFSIAASPGFILENEKKFIQISNYGFQSHLLPGKPPEHFPMGGPAQVFCSINLQNLKSALPDINAAGATSIAGNLWKNFSLKIGNDESGNMLLHFSLECLKEDENSLLTLFKSLEAISSEKTANKNQDKNSSPVF
jgi:hypothetical protein